MDSILTSIKKLLGIPEEDTSFDPDLVDNINSVLAVLNQIGVGPPEGFSITDKNDLWSDFILAGPKLNLVKSYVYHKVKLIFSPPTSTAAIESIKQLIAEFEWRILITPDPAPETEEEDGD